MTMRRGVMTAGVSVLVLASCSGAEQAGSDPAPVGPTATGAVPDPVVTSAPVDEAASTTGSGVFDAAGAELAAVPCEVAGREPSAVEESLLVEPGAFSGEAFDAEAAARAAAALEPSSDEQWAQAVWAQVQGDHAQTVCQMMVLSADLGDAAATPTAGAAPQVESVGSNHFAVVLDASGSMAAQAAGGTAMDEAKGAIEEFVGALPERSTVSLRIYGHEGSNTEEGKAQSCASSEVVFSGEPADPAFGAALAGVEPVGYTPLALAIGDAQGDVPAQATDAIMYVVSDGLETCGGDPVGAAREVAASGVNPVINVIGFRVADSDQEALRAIATAGGGEFTTADSGAELSEYWLAERQALRQAWQEWRRAELGRVSAGYQERIDEVYELYPALSSGVAEDALNASDTVLRLRLDDVIDAETFDAVRAAVDERRRAESDYIDEFRSNVLTLGDNLTQGHLDAYATSNTRWTDLYRDQQGD